MPNDSWLLTCKDYRWMIDGVEKSEGLTEVQKEELRQRFKEATLPECFWNKPAND
tara:strand:- start:489 stop:653 length:165 start_codon:yes stop_codon:yes gene_type:complete